MDRQGYNRELVGLYRDVQDIDAVRKTEGSDTDRMQRLRLRFLNRYTVFIKESDSLFSIAEHSR